MEPVSSNSAASVGEGAGSAEAAGGSGARASAPRDPSTFRLSADGVTWLGANGRESPLGTSARAARAGAPDMFYVDAMQDAAVAELRVAGIPEDAPNDGMSIRRFIGSFASEREAIFSNADVEALGLRIERVG